MPSAIQQIRELRALHEEGLLNAQEFARRKNSILDSVFALSKVNEDTSNINAASNDNTDLGYLIGQELQASGKEYRVRKFIGQGGMGQVWLADDLSSEAELGYSQNLVLKMIKPEWCTSAAHRRLFIEEATTVRKLAHENIVRVFDWGKDPATGSVFIVMEYLEGQDIESYLRQQLKKAGTGVHGLSLRHALKILRPVAQALYYAWHKHRLVHRDLKPSNIFLCKNGDVKLLDFGIAARMQSLGEQTTFSAPRSGSDAYLPPEHHEADQLYTPQQDVYAMAVLLYYLLEAVTPNQVAVTSSAIRRPQVLNAKQWQLLQEGLNKDASKRPAHALDFIQSLLATFSKDMENAASAASRTTKVANTTIAPASSIAPFDPYFEQRQQRKAALRAEELRRRQQASLALHHLRNAVLKADLLNNDTNQQARWSQARQYLHQMSQADEASDQSKTLAHIGKSS